MPAGALLVPVAGGLALLGGLLRVLPTYPVVAVVGVVASWCGLMIARSAWPLRAAGADRGGPVRRRRKGVDFVAAGILLGGVSAVVAGAAGALAPDAWLADVPLLAGLPLVGLFLSVGTYLLGLLLMPGPVGTYVGRLRRMLDGIGIGICVFFTAWLLLFAAAGLRGAGLTAVLLASIAVSASVVGSVRAVRDHPAALACGSGVIMSMVGLTWLVVALDYHAAAGWILAAAGLLLAGSILTWYVVRVAKEVTCPPEPPEGDGSFAEYPMLALPLAGAVVAAGYHAVQDRGFDSVSIGLGVVGVGVVALRETLAVTDVRRYARRLAAREEHFRSLVVGSTDVTVVLDADLVVRWQSPVAARQFGLSDQDVVGRSIVALVHPEDAEEVSGCLAAVLSDAGAAQLALIEARLRDGFGAWRDTEWGVSDQRSVSAVRALVVHVRDISERKELQRTLHRTAFVDQLTGLPNVRELRRTLAARAERGGVLIVFRVGGVAGVNQVHGHEVGEAVLVEAARRLRVGVSAGDLPARLDGGEFVVFVDGGAVRAQLMATRLLTMLAEPYLISDRTAHLSASAGLAEIAPGTDGDEALRRAELALARACRRGSCGAAEWYDEAMEVALRRRLAIERELPGVASRGELDLVFQPIVRLPERCPVGAEALLRWRHPVLGAVPAAEFLPVADELGLWNEIGDWTLQQSCRQLSAWLRGGWDLWLSMYVSARRLADAAFVGRLTAALDAHLLPPSRIMLEFAEAGLGSRPGCAGNTVDATAGLGAGSAPGSPAAAGAYAVAEHLAELRAMGVRAALAQFGTHPTPLSQLRVLPLDMIKLDRRLLTDPICDGGGPAGALVAAAVNLAHQFDVEVAVEGVQTDADLDAAVAAGCRFAQGDLICRPLVPERLEAYLESHRPSPF